jgi:hypothetical protein
MSRANWEPKYLTADVPLIYALTTTDIFEDDSTPPQPEGSEGGTEAPKTE